MLWLLPLKLWTEINKKDINKRTILSALGAILVLVLYIVILFIVRNIIIAK